MKTRIKSLLLALMLSVNSVGCLNYEYEENEVIVNTDDEIVDDNVSNFENKELYLALCDQVIPKYNYEEYYITPLEIEKIIDSTKIKTTCDNTNFSTVDLIDKIMDNTKEYVSQKNGVYDAFDIGNINSKIDPILLQLCIMESIIENLSNDDSNIEENYCKMSELRIVVDNSIRAEAMYLDDIKEDDDEYEMIDNNTIILNLDNIVERYEEAVEDYKEYSSIYDDPKDIYSYIKKYILEHEFSHVKQYTCPCRREKGEENTSFQILFPSDSCIDGFDGIGQLLLEASAESKIYSDKLSESENLSYVYDDIRDSEGLLLLLSLFQHKDISEYYKAINDTDFEAFYDFLGLDSDLKKSEFYKILYSFEALDFRNNFLKKYDPNVKSMTVGEIKDIVGSAAYVDLYKMFTKNYIEYICNNPSSNVEENIWDNTNSNLEENISDNTNSNLKENILLHEVVKTIILSACYDVINVDGEYEYEFDEVVIEGFLKLDEIFYDFLSEYNNLSIEDIKILKEQSETDLFSTLIKSEGNEATIALYEKYSILKNVMFSINPSLNVWESFNEITNQQNDVKVLSK